MKRSILLAISFCFLFAHLSFAQNSKKKKPEPKVPAVVQNAFSAKYPNLKVKDWDWEAQKETYEADFLVDGKEKEASFSTAGKWLKTKTEITKAELPAAVVKTVTTGELAAWQMTDFSHVESADKGLYYKIRFKKGQEEQSLKFDANGKQMEKKAGLEKKPQ